MVVSGSLVDRAAFALNVARCTNVESDPIYGYEQGFRNKPQLPCQVYRFEEESGDLRVVADGFGRPNGLCFAPDESVIYITDTDWIHGDGTRELQRVSTM